MMMMSIERSAFENDDELFDGDERFYYKIIMI
jgi:hypothetical protein